VKPILKNFGERHLTVDDAKEQTLYCFECGRMFGEPYEHNDNCPLCAGRLINVKGLGYDGKIEQRAIVVHQRKSGVLS
jgi:uncharacterized protein YbaR (Trm112 family)